MSQLSLLALCYRLHCPGHWTALGSEEPWPKCCRRDFRGASVGGMCRLDMLVSWIIAQPTCILWLLLMQNWCVSIRTQQQETKPWHQNGEEAMERLSGLRLETAWRRRHKCSGCCMALQLLPCMVTAYHVPSAARLISRAWAGGERKRLCHGPGKSWASPAPWRKQRRDIRGKGETKTFSS